MKTHFFQTFQTVQFLQQTAMLFAIYLGFMMFLIKIGLFDFIKMFVMTQTGISSENKQSPIRNQEKYLLNIRKSRVCTAVRGKLPRNNMKTQCFDAMKC